jgi:formate dehydrogenase major subunit
VHEKFPLIMTSGRLVEYEGGGEETRSNPWLAELQQEMFVEINPKAPPTAASATASGWVKTPDRRRLNVQALVTERVGPDTVFLPFHFSGRWQGATCWPTTRPARTPSCAARRSTPATTYGYDSVTMMQETKTTVCKIEKA